MSLKLHLGCGKRNIPGFVNIDEAIFKHIDYYRDVRDLSIFQANSVELIYASHVFEYFDRFEAQGVLKEWRRVLKPGGVLRLAVPNFRRLVEVAMLAGLDKILGPLYGKMLVNGKYIYHKTVYDYDSLKKILEDAGFKNIRKYDWRKTIHKDYDDCSQAYYPHMDKEHGILISLNVEAEK